MGREWLARPGVKERQARDRAARYAANREKAIADSKAWRDANPDWVRAHVRDPEVRARRLAAGRKYSKQHPEKMRAKAARRRAEQKAAAGRGVTPEDIEAIYKLQRGKCAICGKALRKKFDADHIVPLTRGGEHDPANIQLTCPRCNRAKQNKDPIEHARALGRLL